MLRDEPVQRQGQIPRGGPALTDTWGAQSPSIAWANANFFVRS